MLSGDGFFISTFLKTCHGKQMWARCGLIRAKSYFWTGSAWRNIYLSEDAFLCAANGIDIDVAFTKRMGAGLFGGEGFILQRLSGYGRAFIHAGGTIIPRTLAPGKKLRVDTGCLVAMAPTVDYDIQFVGGFKNAMFGGEGLFLAQLTGPGLVYLQSLPFSRLADRVINAARWSNRDESRGVAGIGGGILGSLCGDNHI